MTTIIFLLQATASELSASHKSRTYSSPFSPPASTARTREFYTTSAFFLPSFLSSFHTHHGPTADRPTDRPRPVRPSVHGTSRHTTTTARAHSPNSLARSLVLRRHHIRHRSAARARFPTCARPHSLALARLSLSLLYLLLSDPRPSLAYERTVGRSKKDSVER